MTERGSRLIQYQFSWPAFDVALLVTVMRWLMLLLIVAGTVWLLRGLFGKLLVRVGRAEAATAQS
jgi:ribose/xylose/arabinose/galactoside ABC-type transport system permease subunit